MCSLVQKWHFLSMAMSCQGTCVKLKFFMILCGIGLGVVYGIRHRHINKFEKQSLQLAQDMGDFYCM
jgi:hypothetical protein